MIETIRRWLCILAFDVSLFRGRVNPRVLALALGRWPRKLAPEEARQRLMEEQKRPLVEPSPEPSLDCRCPACVKPG
jgi:hypothetical protein